MQTKPTSKFIYLASRSPRRAQLLDQLGVAHRPLPGWGQGATGAEALESALDHELPMDYVQRVAGLKLQSALDRLNSADQAFRSTPILCADTTVALGHEILGKPETSEAAFEMLERLSGQTHRVFTAVCLSHGASPNLVEGRYLSALSESVVEFDRLSDQQIADYVQSGEPMGKAGAYAVQGRAGAFIKRIEGSYSGIMGLPLFETAQLLAQLGI